MGGRVRGGWPARLGAVELSPQARASHNLDNATTAAVAANTATATTAAAAKAQNQNVNHRRR